MPATHVLKASVGPLSGIGLFTGKPASVTIHPGAGDGWITIRRREGGRTVACAGAHVAGVMQDTAWSGMPAGAPVRNTTLDGTIGRPPQEPPASVGPAIATVEHLLGALAGLGVREAIVDLDGPEVPVFDGSADVFVRAMLPALRRADSDVEPIVLRSSIEVHAGDAWITAGPPPAGRELEYAYELDYGPASPIRPQRAAWAGSMPDFAEGIAPARTFSPAAEANAARALGLFASFTPRDLVIVGDDGNPVDNAWRFPDEPARHKVLDLIGDLALLGRPLHASVTARRSGHALTHELCRRILARA